MASPLGQYGAITSAVLAVLIVGAAVVAHVIPGFAATPWLDNAALIAAGVVFGTQVVQNGTQAKAATALALAQAAHDRLNVIHAPATPVVTPTPASGSSTGTSA